MLKEVEEVVDVSVDKPRQIRIALCKRIYEFTETQDWIVNAWFKTRADLLLLASMVVSIRCCMLNSVIV